MDKDKEKRMDERYCVGVDIGGTAIKFGLFNRYGVLTKKWSIKTNTNENGRYILSEIADAIFNVYTRNNLKLDSLEGIGVGVPGPVDASGVVKKCVNLGWDIVDVKSELERLVKVPVTVGNDANVAALGEMYKGSAKEAKNLVMITLGTGVGGGIIVNEQILNGIDGAAGEIGHLEMSAEETECCGCGKKGCLEQYASATGIVRLAKQALNDKDICEMYDTKMKGTELSAEYIFALAKSGDPLAEYIVEEMAKKLGIALAQIACIVNPEIFVIGGGVAAAGDFLLEKIQRYYQAHAFHAAQNTRFVLASLGNDAGIYGGAKLALK